MHFLRCCASKDLFLIVKSQEFKKEKKITIMPNKFFISKQKLQKYSITEQVTSAEF